MRLAEKTIELNFCRQFRMGSAKSIFWFGLTQSQEAEAGFDACTRVNGKLLLFQFKASCEDRSGSRRFHAPHEQMDALVKQVGSYGRSVFYAFPMVGTTLELKSFRGDILGTTYLLDVRQLKGIPPPTTDAGTVRKSGWHYVDIRHGQSNPAFGVIHSERIQRELIRASDFAASEASRSDGFRTQYNPGLLQLFTGHAAGAVIYDRKNGAVL